VFLAAASQRTKRIRLAHGIIQLTTNHPARVAERVSTLDLLSHGRVEFGMGEGSSITELHPFGRRFRDKRAVWEDAVRAVIPMFTSEAWEYHGEYFDFPLRNVLPKPYQKPHPPLWVAARSSTRSRWRANAVRRARLPVRLGRGRPRVGEHLYNAFVRRQEKLTDYQTNANLALVSGFMCCESDEEALQKADGWTFFQFSLRFYAKHGPVAPGSVNLWQEYQSWKESRSGQQQRRSGLVGSPRRCAGSCAGSRNRTSTR